MIQLAITARDNKNLFSNYYLDNQIKNNPEWKKEEHKAAFSEIKKLYDTEKYFIPTLNEKQLEQRFFGPIFKILNHTVEVNEGTEQGEFPDYAFFPDIASRNDAKKMGNSLYNNAIAIGEVKRWGIELEKWVIGDTYLSEAINLLSRSRADGGKLDFVDYSTPEIRHLGSIYEGLLEYKLRVAEDEMVVNGGEWVKLEEFNKDRKQKKVFSDFNEFDRVKKGQIYLATDKGDRKATGSYYTPDYIVNYIVKNTVGPAVDEKWKEAQANEKSFVDATLS